MNDKDVKWAILRMGLWQRQEKVDATAIDWNRLLAWAKKQTLLGVLIDGIMMLPADQRPDGCDRQCHAGDAPGNQRPDDHVHGRPH